MNNSVNSNFSVSDKDISLYEVWQKLIKYKKLFWIVFAVVFISGIVLVVLTPIKYTYTFSQVIEIGKYTDSNGHSVRIAELGDIVIKIKRILFPRAMHEYRVQKTSNIFREKPHLIVEKWDSGEVRSNILVISIRGSLANANGYKFIFQRIIRDLANETKYIDFRVKYLSEMKANLEHRLANINNIKPVDPNDSLRLSKEDGRKKLMGKDDTNFIAANLSDAINKLYVQIDGSYNTRAVSEFTISDKPPVSSKLMRLFLVAVTSFVFAFLSVLVANSIFNIRSQLKKHGED